MFTVGFVSQWWLRTRHPRWFAKYNYILAAGLDGGTQVRFINIYFVLISFTKPCWAGCSFHSFVCCSRSIWEFSLDAAVVRTPFCILISWWTVLMHVAIFLGGVPIKEVGQTYNQFLRIDILIPIFPGNYDRCAVIPSP